MNVTQASQQHSYYPQAANTGAPTPGGDPPEPREKYVMDTGGGFAAAALGLVMAGGAKSLGQVGFSPAVTFGFDAFVGGSIGLQMADNLGKSKVGGAAIGAGLGLAAAYAGTQFGWPGALATSAAFLVLRGVVLPSMLNR